jgi:hypothetical protein
LAQYEIFLEMTNAPEDKLITKFPLTIEPQPV